MNRRCIFIFHVYRNWRKVSEISGICLFLVTHLNHELTQAAFELRVWLTRARSGKLENFQDSEISFYRPYVDDTFCLFHSENQALLYFDYIN